jgi:hypothetical protein
MSPTPGAASRSLALDRTPGDHRRSGLRQAARGRPLMSLLPWAITTPALLIAACGGQTDTEAARAPSSGGAASGGGAPASGAGTGGAAAPGCTGTGGLSSWPAFATGTGPTSVTTGDLNLDGKPDLAVANWDANAVSVLLGKGDGSFATKVDYTAAAGPVSVATGDFDLDGRLDLAVAGHADNGVRVLLGNGDGTLADPVLYATGEGPTSVATGDFNLDGKPDLAVANSTSMTGGAVTVSVLLGNGDGTFATKAEYEIGRAKSLSGMFAAVAVGDFNVDGRLDLAATNQDAYTVAVLLGNGDGTFGTKVDYATGAYPSRVAVGDFNLDSKPDLAVAISTGAASMVSVLLGNGDGTFATNVNYPTVYESSSVAVADLNLDSKPDLAVATAPVIGMGGVAVLLGNGDGTFAPKVDFATGTQSSSVAVGDFDLDGRPDLAVTDYRSSFVTVLLGKCVSWR